MTMTNGGIGPGTRHGALDHVRGHDDDNDIDDENAYEKPYGKKRAKRGLRKEACEKRRIKRGV